MKKKPSINPPRENRAIPLHRTVRSKTGFFVALKGQRGFSLEELDNQGMLKESPRELGTRVRGWPGGKSKEILTRTERLTYAKRGKAVERIGMEKKTREEKLVEKLQALEMENEKDWVPFRMRNGQKAGKRRRRSN